MSNAVINELLRMGFAPSVIFDVGANGAEPGRVRQSFFDRPHPFVEP
jgi:hypothetical protein